MWSLGAPARERGPETDPKVRAIAAVERMTGVPPNPAFVTEKGTEACVCCGADTGVPAERDISLRHEYTIGAGQACSRCAGD
jgi:hypothetical protein